MRTCQECGKDCTVQVLEPFCGWTCFRKCVARIQKINARPHVRYDS